MKYSRALSCWDARRRSPWALLLFSFLCAFKYFIDMGLVYANTTTPHRCLYPATTSIPRKRLATWLLLTTLYLFLNFCCRSLLTRFSMIDMVPFGWNFSGDTSSSLGRPPFLSLLRPARGCWFHITVLGCPSVRNRTFTTSRAPYALPANLSAVSSSRSPVCPGLIPHRPRSLSLFAHYYRLRFLLNNSNARDVSTTYVTLPAPPFGWDGRRTHRCLSLWCVTCLFLEYRFATTTIKHYLHSGIPRHAPLTLPYNAYEI